MISVGLTLTAHVPLSAVLQKCHESFAKRSYQLASGNIVQLDARVTAMISEVRCMQFAPLSLCTDPPLTLTKIAGFVVWGPQMQQKQLGTELGSELDSTT